MFLGLHFSGRGMRTCQQGSLTNPKELMSMRQFVSGFSIVLAGWLAITFFQDVPAQRYLPAEKGEAATKTETPAATSQAETAGEATVLAVSVKP
jgi:hypothetical protein